MVMHKASGIKVSNASTSNIQHNADAAYDDCCAAVAKYNANATLIAPAQVVLYPCCNAPRPNGAVWTWMQDGWTYANGTRTPIMRKFFHIMTTECQRGIDGEALKDRRCTGCMHIRK